MPRGQVAIIKINTLPRTKDVGRNARPDFHYSACVCLLPAAGKGARKGDVMGAWRPLVQSRQPTGLARDCEEGDVTQGASGPVPGFLLSSLPQQLLETQRNHTRETEVRRE